MRPVESIPAAPPPELRFRRRVGPVAALRELWEFRELAVSLAERNLRARYKQAFLGAAWVLVQPLSLILVFTLLFRHAVKVDTAGVPYPLYSLVGLLPWSFFSGALSSGGSSLLANISLLNKVYCPREVFPLSAIVVALVDSAVALIALVGLFVVAGRAPRSTSYWVPVLVLMLLAFTYGATLLIASLVVYLRDIRNALPLILQVGLFATPVAYGLDVVPERYQLAYCAANPLAPIIDGLRRSMLYGTAPDLRLLGVAAITTVVVLVLGSLVFKRLETGFADVV